MEELRAELIGRQQREEPSARLHRAPECQSPLGDQARIDNIRLRQAVLHGLPEQPAQRDEKHGGHTDLSKDFTHCLSGRARAL